MGEENYNYQSGGYNYGMGEAQPGSYNLNGQMVNQQSYSSNAAYPPQYNQTYGQPSGQNKMQNGMQGYNQMAGQGYMQPGMQGYVQQGTQSMAPAGGPSYVSASGNNVKAKSNFIPGLVGAFLGSLIGVALWVGIYHLGYIAGIAGAVMIVCSFAGYEKLGKGLDVKGIITSVVMSLVMLYVAGRISVSLELYLELKDYLGGSFFDYYRGMYDLLESADAIGSFWKDLFMGYFLFIIVSVSYIIRAFKSK